MDASSHLLACGRLLTPAGLWMPPHTCRPVDASSHLPACGRLLTPAGLWTTCAVPRCAALCRATVMRSPACRQVVPCRAMLCCLMCWPVCCCLSWSGAGLACLACPGRVLAWPGLVLAACPVLSWSGAGLHHHHLTASLAPRVWSSPCSPSSCCTCPCTRS